ncbi:MAG: hypothetical protein LBN99_03915 [Oscillospiraceae bacterium]|jgi:hypothetical protein|nr:hypothetical protein [Oscillospiraceae bacterium]
MKQIDKAERENEPLDKDGIPLSVIAKAKKFAWYTAIGVPLIVLLSISSAIKSPFFPAILLLPVSLFIIAISVVVLRFISKVLFIIVLSWRENKIARVIAAVLLIAAALALLYFVITCVFLPSSMVKELIPQIPLAEEEFVNSRAEFEKKISEQENEWYGPYEFWVMVPGFSGGAMRSSFVYEPGHNVKTKYKSKFIYQYRLDDDWYMYIEYYGGI